MGNKKKNNKIIKQVENILSPIFFVILIIAIYLGIFLFSLDFFYQATFLPRTYIAGINVSGLDKLEARQILEEKAKIFNQGMIFEENNLEKKYLPQNFGVNLNIDATLNQAYEFGREPLTLSGIKEKLLLLTGKHDIAIVYDINEELLKNFIDNEFIPTNIPQNSSLSYQNEIYSYQAGSAGQALNKKYLVKQILKNTRTLSLDVVLVPYDQTESTILESETIKSKIESRKILNKNISLIFEDQVWEINEEDTSNWLDFIPGPDGKLQRYDYLSLDNFDLDKFIIASLGLAKLNGNDYNQILTASLNREGLGEYLKEIADEIDIKAQNAKFKINDGKLELLKPAEKGRELMIEKNFAAIIDALYSSNSTVELATRETGADITEDNIADLGIIELIALGESDFSNSPQNRRHNIAVASEKLNGILIKPNEEFSLVENIGEVNAESGYLPELVIKENKTIPEYGGGLCQIATTNFRAAVNAGLEITERQNHSYAVSYYNPQGTDATIYIPRPDLKFINDTPGYLLLQTRIEGNKLYFEFYGTSDDREVELQGPTYWDRKSDGSFKAKWIQIVKKDGEILRQQEFISFYDNPAKYH